MTGDHRFEVVPDWVGEILSPSTARDDRVIKMPVYARYGVPCLWLVDPLTRSLETFALEQGRWVVIGLYGDQAEANIPPFQEIALQLGELWAEV
jgi:Uma2 family endonuclease